MEALQVIHEALDAAVGALSYFALGAVKADHKSGGRGPVTEADRAVDRVLRDVLLHDGDGWFSEETVDDFERLKKQRVWVVDPIDGTREFVEGLPEWCVSVGLVENGRAIAGGICNPATGEMFLGSPGKGITYNGKQVSVSKRKRLAGALVLASRTEVRRCEWEEFRNAPFVVRPVGSVAYKLALVAAGLADATWTFSPKNEWDIAAGVALIEAAGGFVRTLENSSPTFNNPVSLISGLFAGGPCLSEELNSLVAHRAQVSAPGKKGNS